MKYEFDKPLAIIDLETTDNCIDTARIVQIGIYLLNPDALPVSYVHLVNPGIPIPPEATEVHGIKDEDVADKKSFAELAPEIWKMLEGYDLAGFNVEKFDIPILEREFESAGIEGAREFSKGRCIIDAMTIFHRHERRGLSLAVRFYLGRDHENAHDALADVMATADVLKAQIARYGLPGDVQGLHDYCHEKPEGYVDQDGKFTWNSEGDAIFNFGPADVKGCTLQHVAANNPGMLNWIIGKDFSDEVKEIARKALNGEFPEKE